MLSPHWKFCTHANDTYLLKKIYIYTCTLFPQVKKYKTNSPICRFAFTHKDIPPEIFFFVRQVSSVPLHLISLQSSCFSFFNSIHIQDIHISILYTNFCVLYWDLFSMHIFFIPIVIWQQYVLWEKKWKKNNLFGSSENKCSICKIPN